MSDLDIWGDPKKHEPDADEEGEEIDPEAPSSESDTQAELDSAMSQGWRK